MMMNGPVTSPAGGSGGEPFAQLFRAQCDAWPGLELCDLLKALYQSVFGCGHLIGPGCCATIQQELPQAARVPPQEIEPLGRSFCRLHLHYLKRTGLSAQTLARLMELSSQTPTGTPEELEHGLSVLLELCRNGELPFDSSAAAEAVGRWQAEGCPALHHSAAMNVRHHPAYRVLHRAFVWLLPLLAQIDRLLARQGGGIVAIEGGSASGKTTLAALLAQLYDCQVFHMDDFFLQPAQRTPERLAQPGGNVDRERFLAEVLLPVTRKETVQLRAYDCHSRTVLPAVERPFRPLTIVEGAYSMHPELAPYYDCSAFLAISSEQQLARLQSRNTPAEQTMFRSTWMPLEQHYFDATDAAHRCTLILEVSPCER